MTQQTTQGTHWKASNFDKTVEESGSPKMKGIWAENRSAVIHAANKNNISPMAALAMLAGTEAGSSPDANTIAATVAQFSEYMGHYGGDMRKSLTAMLAGQQRTDESLANGGLPSDKNHLDYQERVLTGYNNTLPETLMSHNPKLEKNSNEPSDHPTRPASNQAPRSLPGDATPGEMDSFLRDQQPRTRTSLPNQADLYPAPNLYRESSVDTALDLMNTMGEPKGEQGTVEDLRNAFIGGVSTIATDTALLTGVIAGKLGLDEAGSKLVDWSIGAHEEIGKRFAVENPNFATQLSAGLGSMVIPMFTGGMGRLAAVGLMKKFGMKWSTEAVKKGLAAKVGKAVADRAGQIGFAAGAAGPESYSQAGNTYFNALQQGATEDEAWVAARNDGFRNIGILSVTDMVLGMGFGVGWRQISRNAISRGASEGFQEISQGISQRWATQDYSDTGFHLYDQDMLAEGGVGFILGAVVGTGMASLGAGAEATEKTKRAASVIYAEDEAIGLYKGTLPRLDADIIDNLRASDVKPRTPEETERYLQMQIAVALLEQESKGVVNPATGIPIRVSEALADMNALIQDKALVENMTETELRNNYLFLSVLENHTVVQYLATGVAKNHTIEEQLAAAEKAVDFIEESGSDALSPQQRGAITGMMVNLVKAGKMPQELLNRFSKADRVWSAVAHLAVGQSAAKYSGEVVPRYAEGDGPATGKPIGWDVVYRAAAGIVNHPLQFQTEAEAVAKLDELRSDIRRPEDFGVTSVAAHRVAETETTQAEKGETAQQRVDRLSARLVKLNSSIKKANQALNDPKTILSRSERKALEQEIVNNVEEETATREVYEDARTEASGTQADEAGEATAPVDDTKPAKKVEAVGLDEAPAPPPVGTMEKPAAPEEPVQRELFSRGLPERMGKKTSDSIDRLTAIAKSLGYNVDLDATLEGGVAGRVTPTGPGTGDIQVSPANIAAMLEVEGEVATLAKITGLVNDVLAHELGHTLSTKDGKKFNEHRPFVSALLAEVAESDFELSERVAEKLGRYDAGDVSSEVMADLVADILVTDEGMQFLEDYVATNQDQAGSALSLIQLAKKWLKNLIKNLGGNEDALARTMLRRLEQLEARIKTQVKEQTSVFPQSEQSKEKPVLAVAEPGARSFEGVASPQGPVFDSYAGFRLKMNSQIRNLELAERKLREIEETPVGEKRKPLIRHRDKWLRQQAEAEETILEYEQLNPEFNARLHAEKDTTPVSPLDRTRKPAKGKAKTGAGIFGRSVPSKPLTYAERQKAQASVERLETLQLGLTALQEQDVQAEGPDDAASFGEAVADEVSDVLDKFKNPFVPKSSAEIDAAIELLSALPFSTEEQRNLLFSLTNNATPSLALDALVDRYQNLNRATFSPPVSVKDEVVTQPGAGPLSDRSRVFADYVMDYIGDDSTYISRSNVASILYQSGIDQSEIARLRRVSPDVGSGQSTYLVHELSDLLTAHELSPESIAAGFSELATERSAPFDSPEGPLVSTQERLGEEGAFIGSEAQRAVSVVEDATRAVEAMETEHTEYQMIGLPFKKSAKEAHQDPDNPATQGYKNSQFEGARTKHQSFREKLDEGRLGFYNNFIDQGHQAKHIIELMSDPTTEELLLQGRSFYHNMKGLMTGWGSAADMMIQKGWFSFTEEGQKIQIRHGRAEFRGKESKGLGRILDEHGIERNEETWGDFNAYLEAKRAVTLYDERPDQIHDDYPIDQAYLAVKEQEAKHPTFAAAAADLDLFARSMLTFLHEMGNISESAIHSMLTTSFYMPMHAAGLEESQPGPGGSQSAIRGVDAFGLLRVGPIKPPLDELSAQAAQIVHAGYSNYTKVQLAKLLAKQLNLELGEILDLETGYGLHTRGTVVGSTSGAANFQAQLLAQVDVLAKQYNLDEETIAKVRGVLTGDSTADLNVQIWMSKIDLGENMISYYEDGKFRVMRVHQDIADRFQQEGATASGRLVEIAGKFTRLLRTGATLDPGFWARNFLRDVPAAMMGAIGMVNNPADMARFMGALVGSPAGYVKAIRDHGLAGVLGSGTIADAFRGTIPAGYYLHGAGMATLSSRDQEADFNERRQTVDGLRRKGLVVSAANVLRHPLQFLEHMSSTMETATRLATYNQRLKDHGGTGVDWHIMSQMASLDSRDATIDFARMGKYGRILNKLSPFWNAQVQGLDKMARSFKESPGGTLTRGMMMLTLPSMALYAVNAEEPWYQRLPDWQKNMFWVFSVNGGKTIYRIPKPFDWGMLFASMPERMADQMLKKDPVAFKNWVGMFSQMMLNVDPIQIAEGNLGSALSALPVPPIGGSIAALVSGYDPFTQAKIISPGLENLKASAQYTHNTSWLARAGVEFLENNGVTPILNPIEIDYMVRANFGGLGVQTLSGLSAAARKLGIGKPPEGRYEIKDFVDRAVFLSAFNVDEHSPNSSYSTRFHETLRATAESARTIARARNTLSARDMERFNHLVPLANVSQAMRSTAEQAKVYTAMLKILENQVGGDPDVKRSQHHKIVAARDVLYQKANEAFSVAIEESEKISKTLKARKR